jgi:hypothetical protein
MTNADSYLTPKYLISDWKILSTTAYGCRTQILPSQWSDKNLELRSTAGKANKKERKIKKFPVLKSWVSDLRGASKIKVKNVNKRGWLQLEG